MRTGQQEWLNSNLWFQVITPGEDLPGFLVVSMGILDAFGAVMIDRQGNYGGTFVDDDYGSDLSVTAHELVNSNHHPRPEAVV
jgi:hypothetical protein